MNSAAPTPGNPTPSAEQVDALVQTSFDVVAVVTRVGAEHDLSLTLVRLIGILRDRTLTMAELADYLGLERSTVSGLIDRAERRGLVARQPSAADGRSVELRITDDGQKLAAIATAEIADRLAPLVGRMPQDLQRALPLLRDALQGPPRR